jgi:hypothetical protein
MKAVKAGFYPRLRRYAADMIAVFIHRSGISTPER